MRARAAPDLFRLTLALAGAALAFAALALVLAGRSMSVSPDAPVHELGRTIVYPSANPAALAVLALAGFGLVVLVRALCSTGRQVRAQRALSRSLAAGHVGALGDVAVIRGSTPTAMCAGLRRPCIYVTTAALDALAPRELAAVLAHEAHHRRQHDPLRLAVAQVLGDALPFLPPVRRLAREHALLTEIDADAAALHVADGDAAPLANAMLRLGSALDGAVGIEAGRVDSLLGVRPGRALPVWCGLGVLAGLALLALVALLAARTAAFGATLALPVLSRQPCVVALALLPGGLGALAAVFLRRR
jgi:hypothetical protein